MHDVHLEILQRGIALHKEKKFEEAEKIYNRLLNRFPFSEDLLYLLADIDLRQENHGRAINLLSNLLQNNPKHGAAWCNLGAAFRKENDYEKAHAAWMHALAQEETVEVCNNLATLYADSAQPKKALEWIERSLKLGDSVAARWQKALALLSMKQWDEGWKLYESRQELEEWDSRKSIEVPIWDGKPVDRLYIHGEQGVGDEIMFASAIPKMIHLAREITFEANPKVAGIIKQTWPQFKVVKEETRGKYDAKIPVGSLIGKFGIHSKPYLQPHPDKVRFYRRELEALGKPPYLALTWFGGQKQTRCEDRSLQLSDLDPFRGYTCVSAQYSEHNPYIESERQKCGLPRINEESAGLDLHDQAALLKAVDAVVTVQQTAVHVAGGVGAKTFAIIGSHPHWRYGIEGDRLPFYSTVDLFRRKTDWSEVVDRVAKELNAYFSGVQKAERATA